MLKFVGYRKVTFINGKVYQPIFLLGAKRRLSRKTFRRYRDADTYAARAEHLFDILFCNSEAHG